MRTFAIGAVLTLSLPILVFGAEFRSGDNPSVQMGESIQDDIYIAGGSISSAGSVSGDLIIPGVTILVSGPVGQDLIAGGGNITLTGTVGDDARVGGGSISIQGRVNGDLVAGGGTVSVGSQVGGDAVLGGGSVRIDAPILGDVRAGGGSIYINAPISGNVEIDADKLELGPAAVINGSLTYRSPKEMTKADEARILGAINYEPRERGQGKAVATLVSFWLVLKVLMLLALSLVLGLVFRRFSKEVVNSAASSPWLELGRGLVTVIVLPVASILLFITVIGIPFGILGLIALIALGIMAAALSPILIGSLLYKWITKSETYAVSWQSILLGILAYIILWFIPIIGWIILALFWLAALGANVGLKWRIAKEWR